MGNKSTNTSLKRTLAAAFKYCANAKNVDEMRILLDDFMVLLQDGDITVRTEAMNSFAYLGKHHFKVIKNQLNEKLL